MITIPLKQKTRLASTFGKPRHLCPSLCTYPHSPTELFVRMMIMMMCNAILHISCFDATKVNHFLETSKDLSQKVQFIFQNIKINYLFLTYERCP